MVQKRQGSCVGRVVNLAVAMKVILLEATMVVKAGVTVVAMVLPRCWGRFMFMLTMDLLEKLLMVVACVVVTAVVVLRSFPFQSTLMCNFFKAERMVACWRVDATKTTVLGC